MLENRLLIPLHISVLHEVWEYYWPNLAYCKLFWLGNYQCYSVSVHNVDYQCYTITRLCSLSVV